VDLELAVRRASNSARALTTTGPAIAIDVLPAGRGDSLWVECDTGRARPWRMIFDGGMPKTFPNWFVFVAIGVHLGPGSFQSRYSEQSR
jgi:hypothetical protein